MRRLALALVVCWFGLVHSLAQAPSPELKQFVTIDAPVVALIHVRVIDGTGAPAREDQTIVVRQGTIVSVGAATSASVPADAKTVDLTDRTVIPGLVGMHDHMFYPAGDAIFHEMAISYPRLYLAGGVTTIRTTGSIEPYTDLAIKRQIDDGKIPGPRMHVSGPYLEGPGAWASQLPPLTSPDEARATVNFWLDRGVDHFKAYNFLSRQVLGAAIQAAHARGAKVTGHLCSIGFREAAALGIDNLEHGLAVDTELFPGKKPDECPDARAAVAELAKMEVSSAPIQEIIRDLVAHHVAITSTLPVFEIFVPGRAPLQQRVLDALSVDARAAHLAARVRIDTPAIDPATGAASISPWIAMFKKEMEFERAFVKAGGLLLAGLDPTGAGGVVPGFGDQREVELLVEAGFSAVEAIQIATANGAQYLGEADQIGSIAPGKRADLVIIKGNPARAIQEIENVETVLKGGVGYDPARLIASVRGLVGIR